MPADDIRIRFYIGPNEWQPYTVRNLHTVLNHRIFNATCDSVFYHYGFTQSVNSANVRDVIDASVTHGDQNFFLIYYLTITTVTSNNALEIGSNLANSYIKLCGAGFPPSRLHLVGFSLGAQIQAIASRTVQSRTNQRFVVGRLTGLDPGQVHTVPELGRLSSADAAFVDTIHTESVSFGEHLSAGHVSYFVNGGNVQPFCTIFVRVCSHNFAPTAWAESIRARSPVFPSLACSTWDDFLSGSCNNSSVGNMGIHTTRISRGRHFLCTNRVSPFSRPQATPCVIK
ncbi:hypothetical protein HA402_008336 [Bradysia odoriphaga]|nr:hypothetical protein HA402_008336 [Bradysia odoriphaga]